VQWNKDVEVYGDNAIELWSYRHENSQEWRNCTQDINPSWDAQQFVYSRNESAALPFDLERAKAGEVVEWIDNTGKWLEIDNDDLVYLYGQENRLRMKYPPKANNGTK
jgi:hypothetical protein